MKVSAHNFKNRNLGGTCSAFSHAHLGSHITRGTRLYRKSLISTSTMRKETWFLLILTMTDSQNSPTSFNRPVRFSSLKFTPKGVENLRTFLGTIPQDPTAYNRFRARFRISDIAWFAGGASTSPPTIAPGTFSETFNTLYDSGTSRAEREKLQDRVTQAAFDLVRLHVSHWCLSAH